MYLNQTIGEILKEYRLNKGYSIKLVGPKVDVSYTYLSKVENNQKSPSPGFIIKLCKVYDINPDNVLAKIGALPNDVQDIVETYGKEAFDVLRNSFVGKK